MEMQRSGIVRISLNKIQMLQNLTLTDFKIDNKVTVIKSAFTAKGLGSVPGGGTKILQALWLSQTHTHTHKQETKK